LREAIYGMPIFPVDESKFYIAGCTAQGSKYVCVDCKFGLSPDTDDEYENLVGE
jgi:hypothetical protein